MAHAGAPFWGCRSSPEAVAPINQETSATSATPYCEHHRHVQKLLSPTSFRFSHLTFSFASHRHRRALTLFYLFLAFSNAILFLPFSLLFALPVYPPVSTPPENSRSFSFRAKANIIAYALDGIFSYADTRQNNDFINSSENYFQDRNRNI